MSGNCGNNPLKQRYLVDINNPSQQHVLHYLENLRRDGQVKLVGIGEYEFVSGEIQSFCNGCANEHTPYCDMCMANAGKVGVPTKFQPKPCQDVHFLRDVPTCALANELAKREGVMVHKAGVEDTWKTTVYNETEGSNHQGLGPATILIVTD